MFSNVCRNDIRCSSYSFMRCVSCSLCSAAVSLYFYKALASLNPWSTDSLCPSSACCPWDISKMPTWPAPSHWGAISKTPRVRTAHPTQRAQTDLCWSALLKAALSNIVFCAWHLIKQVTGPGFCRLYQCGIKLFLLCFAFGGKSKSFEITYFVVLFKKRIERALGMCFLILTVP